MRLHSADEPPAAYDDQRGECGEGRYPPVQPASLLGGADRDAPQTKLDRMRASRDHRPGSYGSLEGREAHACGLDGTSQPIRQSPVLEGSTRDSKSLSSAACQRSSRRSAGRVITGVGSAVRRFARPHGDRAETETAAPSIARQASRSSGLAGIVRRRRGRTERHRTEVAGIKTIVDGRAPMFDRRDRRQ